ncbi:MAG: HAD family hydrolase [Gemmatimonadaceae bacterium]
MLRALTFDYWDTLYDGAAEPARVTLRQAALRRLLDEIGSPAVPDDEFVELYKASGKEAHRWWSDEHRGYKTGERIRWLLSRLNIERPEDCQHVARACEAVDDALLHHPPLPLPGAVDCVRALARRYKLAIVSDTGFASGSAQDRLLEKDGLLDLFPVRVYSMDIGHAKPRREPFAAAIEALEVKPIEALHIGDIERTDIRGALDAGMRAIRCDIVRPGGPSAAEFIARTFGDLVRYLTDPEDEVEAPEAGAL